MPSGRPQGCRSFPWRTPARRAREAKRDQDQVIEFPRFRIWKTGENRKNLADRQLFRTSARLQDDEPSMSVHHMCPSRAAARPARPHALTHQERAPTERRPVWVRERTQDRSGRAPGPEANSRVGGANDGMPGDKERVARRVTFEASRARPANSIRPRSTCRGCTPASASARKAYAALKRAITAMDTCDHPEGPARRAAALGGLRVTRTRVV